MSHGLVTDAPFTREQLLARLDASPAHVIGAASAEGVAVARLLRSLGATVVLHDSRPREELRRAFRTTHGAYGREEQDSVWDSLRPLLDAGHFGDAYLRGIEPGAVVSLGQGWYLDEHNHASVVAAVPDDALIISMIGLYATFARGPIAAITGTNGKSTTVAITDRLLAGGDIPHRTAGNERSNRQFLPEIESLDVGEWLLLEVSNRQLLQLRWSPQVAAITSLTPDHLEEHGGYTEYVATKRKLFAAQRSCDIAVAPVGDEEAFNAASTSAGALVACGIGDQHVPGVFWVGSDLIALDVPLASERGGVLSGRHTIARLSDVRVPGRHNLVNAALAAAVALACGVEPESIAHGLRSFEGKSLRLEQLADIGGVQVWSDIKSTTPEATLAAIEALSDRTLHLVAGGDDKGLEYGELARVIARNAIATILVPGSATDRLVEALDAAAAPAPTLVETLDEALESACSRARIGDAIVVSPAAAGFWTSQLQGKSSLRALVRRRVAEHGATGHTTAGASQT